MRTLLLGALVVGCSNGAEPIAAAPLTNAVASAELLAAGEAEQLLAALQGTFSMAWWRDGPQRHPEVWSIDGETLTRWDGTKEETAKILVVAPCLANVKWPGDTFTYQELVVDGDTIWFGEEGGRTVGERTVVCTSLGVWVLEGTTCRAWKPGLFSSHPSGLNAEDATCSLAANGDFTADDRTWSKHGDVLLRSDFAARNSKPPERFATLADAKAAAAK